MELIKIKIKVCKKCIDFFVFDCIVDWEEYGLNIKYILCFFDLFFYFY